MISEFNWHTFGVILIRLALLEYYFMFSFYHFFFPRRVSFLVIFDWVDFFFFLLLDFIIMPTLFFSWNSESRLFLKSLRRTPVMYFFLSVPEVSISAPLAPAHLSPLCWFWLCLFPVRIHELCFLCAGAWAL